MDISRNHDLSNFNSWKVGGKAEYFAKPKDKSELLDILKYAEKERLKTHFIGGGSNIVASDKGVSGLVICLSEYTGTEVTINKEKNKLEVISGSGVKKEELLQIFLKYKLPPVRLLAGLNLGIGDAVANNDSDANNDVKPYSFFEVVDWIEVLKDKKIFKFTKDELIWSYKKTEGWQPGVILRVGLSWPMEPASEELINAVQEKLNNKVESKAQIPACAAMFSNPKNDRASELIKSCGLNGFEIGGAKVSEKYPNFLINTGNATASDIKKILNYVKRFVHKEQDILLSSKIQFIGQF